MKSRDHTQLLQALADAYARHAPRSAELHRRAQQVLVDGGSHSLRLIRPFPPRITEAHGAYIWDVDGHEILDFWQGHHANILGHNPPLVADALSRAFASGRGLQTGFTDELQIEVAELLCRQTGAERVRFTTSGTLATMYAILLARAFTGRQKVLKVGGGWHGAHPWGLVAVHPHADGPRWRVESEGLPPSIADEIVTTPYNDPEALRHCFQEHGDRLACFIVEPFLGAGGFILATAEYLQAARELADRYGVVLIFDEVISGFRFRAGDLGRLYGVRPDLATFAKIIGGGMPLAAVAGREAILRLCGRDGGSRVAFSGGTYSAHGAALLAARAMLTYLVEHEAEIYPALGRLGAAMRRAIEEAFAAEGIGPVRCTGEGNAVVGDSSFAMPHFLHRDDRLPARAEDVSDPALCDAILRDQALQLALLLEDVHVVHGGGTVSAAHTPADIARLGEACRRAARRIKPYL